jgi:hypothetical protein
VGLGRRFRYWRTRRRWRKAARGSAELIREFVYLDEVSVYSLMASKEGMIATEITDAQASSLEAELSGTMSASSGFAKAKTGGRLQTNESKSTQVLRKAIIQSTFKDLYARVGDSLAIRPVANGADPPPCRSLDELVSLPADGAWVIDPSTLVRGSLVEIDVVLEAEPLFQARTVVSGVLDIIQEDTALFGIDDLGPLAQGAVLNRMLDKLLVGLVPLRGQALHYVVLRLGDGRELIVHRIVYDQLADSPEANPLYLVGVAEESLFWKDIRRIVFSESTYSVLARLGRSSLQSAWTPMKLADVLGRVVPDLGDTLAFMNQSMLGLIAQGAAHETRKSVGQAQREALLRFGSMLAEKAGLAVSEEELANAGLLDAAVDLTGDSPVEHWRNACAPITEYLESKSGSPLDRRFAAECRVAARVEAGIAPLLTTPIPGNAIDPAPHAVSDERLLDGEIIAVYW